MPFMQPNIVALANKFTQLQTFGGGATVPTGQTLSTPLGQIANNGAQPYEVYSVDAISGTQLVAIADANNQLPGTLAGDMLYEFAHRALFATLGSGQIISVGELPAATNPTITSGTVYQPSTSRYANILAYVYASVSGTAGTVTVALGASSTPSAQPATYVPGATSSTACTPIRVRVPPGYYYSVTLSGVTIQAVTQSLE